MNQKRSGFFSPEASFFVLDSSSLEETKTRLFGYTFVNDLLVDQTEDLNGQEPGKDGAYIFIRRQDNTITITQDYVGCYGLYLFQDKDYFAVSNSFLLLAEHIRSSHLLTLNREYADYILFADLCSAVYGETLIREITLLDRRAVLEIDVTEKRLNIHYLDYREKTIALDSGEGIRQLDMWRNKWALRIQSICARTDNIQLDLSGGFDTRGVLALFLSSGIDLSRIMVFSSPDKLHSHEDDYRIASELADKYHFSINDAGGLSTEMDPFSAEEIIDLSFYTKLGFHKEMYFKPGRMKERRYNFSGNGGECIRCRTERWKYTAEEYEDKAVHRFHYLKDRTPETYSRMEQSVRNILSRSFERLRSFNADHSQSLTGSEWAWREIYRETRCRNHYGKAIIEGYLANIMILSPLLDPDLSRLTLSTKECADENMLFAILLDRFAPGLLDVPFEGGRKIQDETIEYARSINRKYPFNQETRQSECSGARTKTAGQQAEFSPDTSSVEEADEILKKATLSSPFRAEFTSIFDDEVYNSMQWYVHNKAFYPLSVVYAGIGIVKARQDCLLSDTLNSSCACHLTNLAQEYQSAEPPVPEPEQPSCTPQKSRYSFIPGPIRSVLRRIKAAMQKR